MDAPALRKPLFYVLILTNIAAVFAGAHYYWAQLSSTPLQLLIFVPDCPLYVLLALPILLKLVKNSTYAFLISVGLTKYGLWTVFALIFHWGAYSMPAALPTTIIFIIGHLGMAIQGAALIPKKGVGLAALLLALGWFLLNDYSDYFLGTVPPIPGQGIELVAALTFFASIALTLGFYLYSEKLLSFPPVRFIREIIWG